ncbi:sulfotransferase [Alteraurantiacibacter aquimixticola]|uniref:Sulfotransferase n=2 Tax=Alteraurantiacibacter aquimixticola TaxID=2489173 RepID=A0A4V4U9H1_9SPHN|nr:sulfotransferase [Alteraurantiacibacter aquimixticola]
MALARRTGLAKQPVLDKQLLMEEASERTGLSDFGDPWFERPFDVLLDALHCEARLNPAGEWAAKAQFLKLLDDRLWAQQWFAEHPEILARPLPRPVIVVGIMRSGTTRMHRLLSADRRFSHLRQFETISPVPRPGFTHGGKDSRITLAKRIGMVAKLSNPKTLDIHPTGAMQPEEELGLLVNSMWSMKHEAQWFVPSYGRWCEEQDPKPAYLQMARLLQLIGWAQQSSSLRPWILKTPQHMMDLPTLLELFPDARLVFTHRDPVAVVGSAASLAWNQTIIYSDHADPHVIGEEWLRKTRVMIERMRKARDSIPAERMIDVHFDEMDSDWRGAMGRVYDFLGLDITPTLPAMADYQRRTGSGKRRRHVYSLSEFGLTEARVAEELGDYVATYGITREGRQRAAS